ncbi:MAG TPA: LamG domain-containing protein, partial [Verrucomicrobiae bacterium]|nr:LamG domain-containing protein [Verrucomicrobiae bacterium]
MKPPYNTLGRLGSTALLVLCAIPIVRASDYQTTVTSQGPIGYYRLNETVQPVFDPAAYATNLGSLGAAADGTFVSSPVLGFQGPFSGVSAIDLNGLSQYIRTPSSTALDTTNFTFETWVKPANAPFFAYVASSVDFEATPGRSGWYLAQDDGVTFGAGSAWVVRIFNQNGTGFGGQVAAPILAADVWVHLVVTYDNTSKVLTMYTNGVLAQSVTGTAGANGQVYVPNQNLSNNDPLTIGARSTLNFFWPGQVAQSAVYGTALSAARVAAHFAAATSAGSYSTAVQSDAPLLYYNYFSSTPAPVAANLGTLGTAGNALFLPGSIAAATGPRPPIYPGFAATNTAAAFVADGGAVRIPALNLNTNTVTISAWISATNLQKEGAGLVVTPGGGLIIDGAFGGFGLGYYWNNTDDTFLWSP